jgi:pimeloyl-ACP methyl ester carboxylesterase
MKLAARSASGARAVKTPTLVLHGTQDRRGPLAAAHFLAEGPPDSRLYLFEGSGHLPIFTATGEFCDVLRRFVRTGEVGPRSSVATARHR